MTDREFYEVRAAARERVLRTSFPAPVRKDTVPPVSRATYGASRH